MRLYQVDGSPLYPWRELELRYLEPVTDPRLVREALGQYAVREERRQKAVEQQRRRAHREHEDAQWRRRRTEAARIAEAERLARETRGRVRTAARLEEDRRAREAAALKQELIDSAAVRHRDASGSEEELEVFQLAEEAALRLRFTALFDPGAAGSTGGGVAVYSPSHPHGPFVWLKGVLHPSEHPGSRVLQKARERRAIVSSYRTWQAAERVELQRRARVAEYEDAVAAARSALPAPVEDSVPLRTLQPTRDDLALALEWCASANQDLHDRLVDRFASCDWDFAAFLSSNPRDEPDPDRWKRSTGLLKQMLSARMAEVAVRRFYERNDPDLRSRELRLTDMSIRQVTRERPFDPTYDLGYPDPSDHPGVGATAPAPSKRIDVKNARMDPDDPSGYSRHYVKRLRVLSGSHAVTVVGAVSVFSTLADLLRPSRGDGVVRILGETSGPGVAGLEEEYGLSTLKLSLQKPGREGQFFPPWIFEAVPFVVAARIRSLRRLREAYLDHPAPEALDELPIPLAIAAGVPLRSRQRAALSSWQVDLADRLLNRGDETRCSLPHVYLTLLRQFFLLLDGPAEDRTGYSPNTFCEMLFVDGDPASPLGIPDPLKSVWGLLQSLSSLLAYGWEQLARFRSFEFEQAGVLYAYTADDPERPWTLMYTHCGNAAACGGKRLVLGREGLCGLCRHLICRQCHFCRGDCRESRAPIGDRESMAVGPR